MVRWVCGVSLKDRRRSEDLCNLLDSNCVADVVRHGRLRWFGQCRWLGVCLQKIDVGARGRGEGSRRGLKDVETVCGGWLEAAWFAFWVGYFYGYVERLDLGQTSDPSLARKKRRFQNKWWLWECTIDSWILLQIGWIVFNEQREWITIIFDRFKVRVKNLSQPLNFWANFNWFCFCYLHKMTPG